ncbi:MAG: D-aminoacyl-tRNA deacylase [Bacteroidota bacterium]
MKVVIQRVSEASVKVNQQVVGEIGTGLLVLAGFEESDAQVDFEWVSNKIINLRIFNDEAGIMNLGCADINAGMLVVSQFTLHASTRKGNRPSYIKAAKPDVAKKRYEQFISVLQAQFSRKIATGIFGADMKVGLVNDGPVTIIIDSKNRE